MIYFLPIGDELTASSRLRVYKIVPHIKDAFIGVPQKYKKGDILVIQKTPDYSELERAKKAGIKVIYDIDDKYDDVSFLRMINAADVVTTDSKVKKEWLEKINKNVYVVPDSLDWDGKTEYQNNKNGIIGWTGYGNNSHYLQDIKDILPFTLRLITSPDWYHHLKDEECKVQMRPWNLETVDKHLAECELSLCYLPKGDFEDCKGEHKLLKSLAMGIPTFTSATPSYIDVFNKAGVGDKYIVKNKEDWKNIKNIGFDDRLKEYARGFTAEKVAKIWEGVILKV